MFDYFHDFDEVLNESLQTRVSQH